MANAQRKEASFDEIREILREVSENQKETDQKFQKTDQIVKENAKNLKRLEKLFIGQWGKLVESLVEGELVNLLRERGIQVNHTATNLKDNIGERRWQIDILAVNGDEVVAVEVKTTLKKEYIDHFVNFLKDFKDLVKEHKDKKVYGAVAYLKANESSDIYAEKQGLYVIRATGDSAKITNGANFRARKF